MARLLLRGGMAPVPEIVEEGVTGFVVGSIDEAVQAVGRISELSRAICRHRFEERYDASRMVDNYLKSLPLSGCMTP